MGENLYPGAGLLTFVGWRTNEDGREEFSAIVVFNNERPDLSPLLAFRETPIRIITAARECALHQCQTALDDLLSRYVGLVESGDAGNWDAETEGEVIAARAALHAAVITP